MTDANLSTSDCGMRKNLPPNVYSERTRHGKLVFYYRERKGPRVRLPAPDSGDFKERYRDAVEGKTARKSYQNTRPGTIAFVIQKYRENSPHWRELSDATRGDRLRIYSSVVETAGDRQIRDVTAEDITRGRNKRNKDKGNSANAYLKAMRPLFRFALEEGYIDVDPCAAVKRVSVHTDGYHVWTIEEVERFEARHPVGTRANLALRIFLYTGLRREDVFGLGRQNIRDGILECRPKKTRKSSGVMVYLTVLPPLAEAIESTPTGDMVFLLNEYGKPFKNAATFGNWFADKCREANVPGRGHGLRKAGATLAAENGATAHMLMSMFGWTKLAQAEVYTRKAERRRLSIDGSAKLLRENK